MPVNMKPLHNATSTPVSPFTDPLLFNLENGNFLSYTELALGSHLSDASFLSLKSQITIYKGQSQVMATSTELVNAYRQASGSYTISCPFMCSFWAGFFTFLANGSRNYGDLDSLQVSHTIYDGESNDPSAANAIYGHVIYNFHAEESATSQATVKTFHVLDNEQSPSEKKPAAAEGTRTDDTASHDAHSSKDEKPQHLSRVEDGDDADENATVVASSSPTKASPAKHSPARRNLSVDIFAANQGSSGLERPSSDPLYDASLLHFNPNYCAYGPHQGTPDSLPASHGYTTGGRDVNNNMHVFENGPQQLHGQPLHAPAPVGGYKPASAGQMQRRLPPQGNDINVGIPPNIHVSMNQPHHHPQFPQGMTQQQMQPFQPQCVIGVNSVPQVAAAGILPHDMAGINDMMTSFGGGNGVGAFDGGPYGMAFTPDAYGPRSAGLGFAPSAGPVLPFSGHAPTISSAPATQVDFFPPEGPPPPKPLVRKKSEQKMGNREITFGQILGYDPLKDAKPAKKAKTKMNFHKFPLNPQVMYKPKK